MRFSAKLPPNSGDVREVTRFAWLPVRIAATWVWMEHYTDVQRYYVGYDGYYWQTERLTVQERP